MFSCCFSRGEKYVVLTNAKKIQVFAERVTDILSGEKGSMLLNRLEFTYQFYQYDSIVSPADCECDTFEQLLMKIPEYVKVAPFLISKIWIFQINPKLSKITFLV